MNFSAKVQEIINRGSIKLRVFRSGVYQQLTFSVKTAKLGSIEYYELFTGRLIELSELVKIANEIGLPVEAPNGRAFPTGKGATDFQKE